MYLRYDINLFGILILAIIYIAISLKKGEKRILSKLFRYLIISVAVMLFLEIIAWQLNGRIFLKAKELHYTIRFIFLWLNPLVPCLWACYIDYKLFNSEKRLKSHFYFMLPMALNTIIMGIHIFTPFIFYIDFQNEFYRLSGMWSIAIINFSLYFYYLGVIYVNRKQLKLKEVLPIVSFIAFPAIGGLIQMMKLGTILLWPLMAVAVLMTYIFLETIKSTTDYLTGLNNRLMIDRELNHLIGNNNPFVLIMFDLDDFKTINDTYGHPIGDQALVEFAMALKEVFKKAYLLGRFAGDEFMVIIRTTDQLYIERLIVRLKEKFEKDSQNNKYPFKLKFSYGKSIFNSNRFNSYESLLKKADEEMYKNKRKNKLEKTKKLLRE